MLKNQLFKDKKLNKTFYKEGYVCVDLIHNKQIEALNTFYNTHKIRTDSGFHTTHFSTDRALKKSIHDFLINQVWPDLSKLLVDFKPVFANYMVKEAQKDSMMPLHADWTYVDETKYCSIAAWIPLCDVDENNGTLGVIPFSQHISEDIRGPRILQWKNPFNDKIIEAAGKLIPLKSGQAIIYNHRLLHFSNPNKSESVRPALNLSMVPENAQIFHYSIPEGFNNIQHYEVHNTDFFLEYDNFQVPEKGHLIKELDLKTATLLNEKLNPFIEKHYQNSFISKIKKLLFST